MEETKQSDKHKGLSEHIGLKKLQIYRLNIMGYLNIIGLNIKVPENRETLQ